MKNFKINSQNKLNVVKISITCFFIIILFIIALQVSFATDSIVSSITIKSNALAYSSDEGSWQVTETAKWIAKGTARIDLSLTTKKLSKSKAVDLVLLLDDSLSDDTLKRIVQMFGRTFLSAQDGNTLAVIRFNSEANLINDFQTTDAGLYISLYGSIDGSKGLSYYSALEKLDEFLKKSTYNQEHELNILMITDGIPSKDIGKEEKVYTEIRETYKNIKNFYSVQYNVGNKVNATLKKISDISYATTSTNDFNELLNKNLSYMASTAYTNFTLETFINSDQFTLNNKNASANIGKIVTNDSKLSWSFESTDLKNLLSSGATISMSFEVKLKDEYRNVAGLYQILKNTKIDYTISNTTETVTSTETPIISNYSKVIYDGNAPPDCTVSNLPPSTVGIAYDVIEISETTPICNGYKFKSYEIISSEVTKIGNSFIMPLNDVTLKATWTKVSISKSADGTIYTIPTFYDYISSSSKGLDTNTDFNSSPIESTSGVYTMAETQKDKYPVHYYRGIVSNNNVLFANMCWKIVRTTETGGIKMIYNGLPDENNQCNNTGTNSQIGTSVFNSSYKSPSDAGYMSGTRYESESKTPPSLYGNDISWDGEKYTLLNTYKITSWETSSHTVATKYHYSCFNDTGTCTTVYYIHYFGSQSHVYCFALTAGKDIETIKNEMLSNDNTSPIKDAITTWYEENLQNYTDKLEDTIWCNDRKFSLGSLVGKDNDAKKEYSRFGAYNRTWSIHKPSVKCSNTQRDGFTVSASSDGNGKLKYPVGLLTADEVMLAGGRGAANEKHYLYTGQNYWTMSPADFSISYARGFRMTTTGALSFTNVASTNGIRPTISLANGTRTLDGNGTATKPYIVE